MNGKFKTFSSFGMVLSDILANGVIVLLILIMTTILIESEKEKQKIEKAKDITVVLSREIMSSLVMNSLKTSPPSILHDYHESQLDKRIIKENIPIFELVNGGVYEVASKKFWNRNLLLTQNSPLDEYLSKLPIIDKNLFRVDIYSINNFHVFMSILRSHNMKPRHWHFVGETSSSNYELSKDQKSIYSGINSDPNASQDLGSAGEDDLLDAPNDSDSTALSENSTNDDNNNIIELSEISDQNEINENGIFEKFDNNISIGNNSQSSDSYSEFVTNNPAQLSLQVAGIPSNNTNMDLSVMDLLITTYATMLHSNQALREGKFSSLEDIQSYDIDVIKEKIKETEQFKLWASNILFLKNLPRSNTLFIDRKKSENNYTSIGLLLDRYQDSVTIYNTKGPLEINAQNKEFIKMNLNTYPVIHKGNRVHLTPNSILTYVDEYPLSANQWRLVALFDMENSQITLGLLFSSFDKKAQELNIKSEENKPSIKGKYIVSTKPSIPDVIETFSIILILLISLSLFSIYRKIIGR
ncbi:hypothetical protein [Aliivibrio finisterrensis]|uniref:Uncharacterized protein n=1 Tax=Aliivibrio finisterrensis TaxID=511998 RepID=A0A6N6RYD9_9GAMM|nr:hypothetical protein [Aliivibrio finisterrensis]KAB2826463.1 hypothetical protein F8B77_00980 [Aliivibrio finisterrensis]